MAVRSRVPWSFEDRILHIESSQAAVVRTILARLSTGVPDAKILSLSVDKLTSGKVEPEQVIVIGDATGGDDPATIRSENYVEGYSGWQITGAGDAEFNSVISRGNLISGNTYGDQVSIIDGVITASDGLRTLTIDPGLFESQGAGLAFDLGDGVSRYILQTSAGMTIQAGVGTVLVLSDTFNNARLQASSDTQILIDKDNNRFEITVNGTTHTFQPSLVILDGVELRGSGSRITFGWGSAGTPTYGFLNDSGLGVYRQGDNSMAFAASGVERARVTPNGLSLDQGVTFVPIKYYHTRISIEGISDGIAQFKTVNLPANMFTDGTKVSIRITGYATNQYTQRAITSWNTLNLTNDTVNIIAFGESSITGTGTGYFDVEVMQYA